MKGRVWLKICIERVCSLRAIQNNIELMTLWPVIKYVNCTLCPESLIYVELLRLNNSETGRDHLLVWLPDIILNLFKTYLETFWNKQTEILVTERYCQTVMWNNIDKQFLIAFSF
jgi:hypothetical protein